MNFSSSSSSSSSYRGSSAFLANTTTPHFPPMPENRIITQEISSSTQDAGQFTISTSPSYTNYAYSYSNSGGASTASRAEERDESGDLPPEEEEREHMFDKVVTPSDVGKLNRLVIPKQHAEKYFPLDSSSSEKGLLLDFEDRSGKSWRFRYSYWNSSQSYVMTKGWSRFVKEKKLDAGDVVSFHRGIGEDAKNHFFIDWRRRPQPPPPQIQFQHRLIHHSPFLLTGPRRPPPPPPVFHHPVRDHRHLMTLAPHPNHHRGSVISYSGLDNANNTYNYGVLSSPNFVRQGGPVVYMRGPPPPHHQMHRWSIPAASSSGAAAPSNELMVLDSVPVVADVQSNAGKRLRLFGVNMDCTVSDSQVNSTELMSHRSSPSVDEEEAVDESLHLSLIHGGTPSDYDLLDKGKSSMSLDFDLTDHS